MFFGISLAIDNSAADFITWVAAGMLRSASDGSGRMVTDGSDRNTI